MRVREARSAARAKQAASSDVTARYRRRPRKTMGHQRRAATREQQAGANLPKRMTAQKAAVEAAIARAKSPQAGQQAGRRTCRRMVAQSRGGSGIARAKARKQEQQAGSEPAEPVDPRKAAVEAAIARAPKPVSRSSRPEANLPNRPTRT